MFNSFGYLNLKKIEKHKSTSPSAAQLKIKQRKSNSFKDKLDLINKLQKDDCITMATFPGHSTGEIIQHLTLNVRKLLTVYF